MDKHISFKQYRNADLIIWAVVVAATQLLITLAANHWFAFAYVVSPIAVVTCLVMMRWGPWAAIHTVVGSLVFTVASGGQWQHYLIFGLGNLLGTAGLLFFRFLGKERVRNSATLCVAFAISVQALMLLGRAIVAFFLGYSLAECWNLMTADLLSVLFTAVAIWIARRADGLFEDQKHYLIRTQEENNDGPGANSNF